MTAHPPAATAPPGRACLVLMLKAPHRSKRRLAARIGARANTAASHLCACALEDATAWPGPVCFAPADAGDRTWLADHVPAGADVVLQQHGNLGERINHVNRTLHARSLERQLFIGTDCPELDASYLLRASAALDVHDTVLGPASDGGVVLMATRVLWPDLSALPWSSSTLLAALSALCATDGRTVGLLEPRSDIDTVADLLAARNALRDDPRTARRAFRGWLEHEAKELER